MPYGLRNALPTFVRAMNKTFCYLIRDIVEVYVDDIVVKTKVGPTLVEDLSLVFDRLRATRTKLNPEKCIFGVSAASGANGVLMRCISQGEGRELLAEIHGGECGSHSSSRTLVGKAFRHGFYWPTALQDAAELVRSCKACQFHAKQIHTPAQALQMIPPSWPFAVWGVDILGPFPRAVGGYRFLYVAIDKFTKWPEVTPVVNITKKSAVAFLRSIVCRFGVPNRIIADNGTQFKSRLFQEYCEDIGIQLCFASVAHPRSNG